MDFNLAVNVASSTASVFHLDLLEGLTSEEVISLLTVLGKVIGHRLPPEKSNLLNSLIGSTSCLWTVEAGNNMSTPSPSPSPSPSPPPNSPVPSPSRPSETSEAEKKTLSKQKKKLQTSAKVGLSQYKLLHITCLLQSYVLKG